MFECFSLPLANWFQRWCSPLVSTAAPPDADGDARRALTKIDARASDHAEDTYSISEEYYKVDQGTLGGFRAFARNPCFAD